MSRTTGIPSVCSSSPAPKPDNCNSCAELKTPPQTITSPRARAVWRTPFLRYSTPVARSFSNATRVASASALLILGLLEVRQHAVPVPSGAATLAPFIVVGGVAAHIDHTVDRASAAQYLTARLVHRPALEFGLGLALVHPVDARIAEQPAIPHRHVNPGIAILAAGL